jgi:hypothetical protein
MELKLGKFITTETPVEDLRSQIMQFSFPGPTAAGINLMELLDKRAGRLAYVTEAVAGQTEKVMQPHAILATRTVWHCIRRNPADRGAGDAADGPCRRPLLRRRRTSSSCESRQQNCESGREPRVESDTWLTVNEVSIWEN